MRLSVRYGWQRIVSSFVGGSKIALLHQQNKTLKAMAETLFRQWFVKEAQVEEGKDGLLADIVTFHNGKSRPDEIEGGQIPIDGGNPIA